MNVRHGGGRTKYGPGVAIELSADEVATAIDAYLVAHGVVVRGPRAVKRRGSGGLYVYVDPSGSVVYEGRRWNGDGSIPDELECPCCGDVGAVSDDGGFFRDGQSLVCGCSGQVSIDDAGPGEAEAWINVTLEPCPPTARCGGRKPAD